MTMPPCRAPAGAGVGLTVAGFSGQEADHKNDLHPWVTPAGAFPFQVKGMGRTTFSTGSQYPHSSGIKPALALIPLTFVWVLVVVNAVNLIDGMNGLATGVAFLTVIGLASAMALAGGQGRDISEAVLLGSLIGLHACNFNLSMTFMAVSGSLFILTRRKTPLFPTGTTVPRIRVFLYTVVVARLMLLGRFTRPFPSVTAQLGRRLWPTEDSLLAVRPFQCPAAA